ncbi:MAG TPA: YggT family protein [Oculatellaceae cyanobacterium]|jgi:YggT family protein
MGALIAFINLYKLILVARILLTWLPGINWYNQPFRFLAAVTDPVMEPFRRLIPPIGGIDFSPILLFFALELLQKALINLTAPPIMSF